MNSTFYEDESLLTREYELLEMTVRRNRHIRDARARRHVNEGFDRRLLMMQASRIFMREATRRQEPLDIYFWEELNVHLNAYYLNLRGALDNLAWALKYEFSLLPDVDEDRSQGRMHCNLFGAQFLEELMEGHGALVGVLRSLSSWEAEIRGLRDPAAHRIPLMCIAGVITSDDQMAEYRSREALAARPQNELAGLSRSYYLRQAQLVAKYEPLFALSSANGLEVRKIPWQIASDHERFLTLASATLLELMPEAANPRVGADG